MKNPNKHADALLLQSDMGNDEEEEHVSSFGFRASPLRNFLPTAQHTYAVRE